MNFRTENSVIARRTMRCIEKASQIGILSREQKASLELAVKTVSKLDYGKIIVLGNLIIDLTEELHPERDQERFQYQVLLIGKHLSTIENCQVILRDVNNAFGLNTRLKERYDRWKGLSAEDEERTFIKRK